MDGWEFNEKFSSLTFYINKSNNLGKVIVNILNFSLKEILNSFMSININKIKSSFNNVFINLISEISLVNSLENSFTIFQVDLNFQVLTQMKLNQLFLLRKLEIDDNSASIYIILCSKENQAFSIFSAQGIPFAPVIEINLKEINKQDQKIIQCCFIWKLNFNGQITSKNYYDLINTIITLDS